MPGDDGRN